MQILINIDVPDPHRSIQFYTTAFDLKVSRRIGTEIVELEGASSRIYLLAKATDTCASPTTTQLRNYNRHWTPVHLDMVVEDIDAAVARALAAGATLESPCQSLNWGKLALMADPFGNGFCLIEFVGRGYGEIATP